MKIHVLRVLSVVSMSLGIIFLFNAFSGLTGFAVANDIQPTRNLFAVCFILIGMLTFWADRDKKKILRS